MENKEVDLKRLMEAFKKNYSMSLQERQPLNPVIRNLIQSVISSGFQVQFQTNPANLDYLPMFLSIMTKYKEVKYLG
jgi:hypothetical protein